MAPSRLEPKVRAVFRPLWQNQAELAQPAVLFFGVHASVNNPNFGLPIFSIFFLCLKITALPEARPGAQAAKK